MDTSYFQCFAITNQDVMNTQIHTRLHGYAFYLQRKFLRVELLDQRVSALKKYFDIVQSLSKEVAPLYTPASSIIRPVPSTVCVCLCVTDK